MLTILLAVGLLAACGEDAAPPASTSAPAAPAAESAPPPAASAPAEDASESAAANMEEEEFTYDAIDTSKLDNSWWQQYSAGS